MKKIRRESRSRSRISRHRPIIHHNQPWDPPLVASDEGESVEARRRKIQAEMFVRTWLDACTEEQLSEAAKWKADRQSPERAKEDRDELECDFIQASLDEVYKKRLGEAIITAITVLRRIWHKLTGQGCLGDEFMHSPDEFLQSLRERLSVLIEKGKTKADKDEYRQAYDEMQAAQNVLGLGMTWLARDNRSGGVSFSQHLDLSLFFDLGYAYAILENWHPRHVARERRAHQSAFASRAVSVNRWANHKAICAGAVAEADRRWEQGEKCLHNDMADYLCNREKFPQFKNIERPEMLRILRPVAKKYGRLLGIKGTRKEK